METKQQVHAGRVEIDGWLCNGSINPLIRSYPQLKELAGADLSKALRYAAIELETYFHIGGYMNQDLEGVTESEREGLFNEWMQHKKRPFWKTLELIPGSGIRTTAQLLAKHGNLNCRAACCDIEDLCEALRLGESCNGLDAPKVAAEFRRFNLLRYYGPCNPNAGLDVFHYSYGCEGTTVVYIDAIFTGRMLTLSPDWKHYTELDRTTFEILCTDLGRRTMADESCKCAEYKESVTWRLWWD